MKTRSDFVSNSSSSSFIIAGNEMSFVHHHGLSKEDFREAFIDLLGGKESYTEHVRTCAGKYSDGNMFHIYDKDIKEDLDYINSAATNYLKHWKSTRMMYNHEKKEYFTTEGSNVISFDEICSKLCDIYGISGCCDIIDGELYNCRCSKYVKSLDKSAYRPVPLHVKKLIHDLYKHYGVLTNKDVLNADVSRFLVHFGDNDVWKLRGIDEPGKNEEKWVNPKSDYAKEFNDNVDKSLWDSDAHTIERVAEVLFNWFKEHGKLKNLKPDETWKILMRDIVAATMHEG